VAENVHVGNRGKQLGRNERVHFDKTTKSMY